MFMEALDVDEMVASCSPRKASARSRSSPSSPIDELAEHRRLRRGHRGRIAEPRAGISRQDRGRARRQAQGARCRGRAQGSARRHHAGCWSPSARTASRRSRISPAAPPTTSSAGSSARTARRCAMPGILDGFGIERDEAEAMIMQARVKAGWVDANSADARGSAGRSEARRGRAAQAAGDGIARACARSRQKRPTRARPRHGGRRSGSASPRARSGRSTTMIRFVVGAGRRDRSGSRRDLPGRGAWVTATRAALENGDQRERVRRAFAARARPRPTLPDLSNGCWSEPRSKSLSLANKAGQVVDGFTKVEAALASGKVIAPRACFRSSGRRRAQARRPSAARRERRKGSGLRRFALFSGEQLDLALGRSNVVHAALLAHPASAGFLARWLRLERWRNGGSADEAAAPTRVLIDVRELGRRMTDTKDTGEKTLRVSARRRLTLKRSVASGIVRQSFSHGRSKEVVVEKVKRRVVGRRQPRPSRRRQPRGQAAPRSRRQPRRRAPQSRAGGAPRLPPPTPAGLEAVRRRAAHADRRGARCARRMRLPTRACARRRNAGSPRKMRAAAPLAKRATAPSARPQTRASATRTRAAPPKKRPSARPSRRHASASATTDGRARRRWPGARAARGRRGGRRPAHVAPRRQDRRAAQARRARSAARRSAAAGSRSSPRSPADEERQRSVASFRRRVQRMTGHRPSDEPKEKIAREVVIPEMITIQELANRMAERARRCDPAADEAGPDAEDHRRDRRRHRPAHRRGDRPHGARASPKPTSRKACSTSPTIRRHSGVAPAGRHHHGPRRPRQDFAARRDPHRPTWSRARPAASPSISAPIR